MKILIHWAIAAIAVAVAGYLIPGVHVSGVLATVATALILGLLNAIVKPILVLLTLPLTILTLGLFSLVLNALIILLADWIVPGFDVDSFWWALAFSIVLSVLTYFLGRAEKTT